MTKTIYLVSSGDYSDYRVHLAFESEDMATAFCERENPFRRGEQYFVEARDLLNTLPEPGDRIYEAIARINPDGSIRDSWETSHTRYEYEEPIGDDLSVEVTGAEVYRLPDDSLLRGTVYIHVRGKTAVPVKDRRDELVAQYMKDPTSAPVQE